MKIAYFGYDFFADCLEVLLKEHQVLKVFSFNTDNKYNFNDKIIQLIGGLPISLQLGAVNLENICELEEQGCDLIISAAYPYKIPVSDRIRGINIHPTLLPEGKGPWPLPYIIMKGLCKSGVTIHKLTNKFDAGPILLQQEFAVNSEDNLESLSCKCQMTAKALFTRFMSDIDGFWQNSRSQDGGSYWPFPSSEDQTVDWSESVVSIRTKIRAYGKLESMATWAGRSWVIRDAVTWQEDHCCTPGDVVHCTNRELVIAASDGFVCVRDYDEDIDAANSQEVVK